MRRRSAAVREVGARIARDGLPAPLCPFVIGITGYGNVSRGVQEVVDALGAVAVAPANLAGLFAGAADRRAVHKVVFAEHDMVARRDATAPFALEEYFQQPELYESAFERRLPQMAVLLNCVFWDTPYPRLVTKAAVRRLYAAAPPLLRVIGDVSCDIEGSIELTVKETHIDDPVYVYDPESGGIADGVAGRGPVVLAVGNLPCELSRESSAAFSAALSPFVPALAGAASPCRTRSWRYRRSSTAPSSCTPGTSPPGMSTCDNSSDERREIRQPRPRQ